MNHQQQSEEGQTMHPQSQSGPRQLQYTHGKGQGKEEVEAAVVTPRTPPPTAEPSTKPTAELSTKPTAEPTAQPNAAPTVHPTLEPTATPIVHVQEVHLPPPPTGPTEEELRLAYEAGFPAEPENPMVETTYALFSDPYRFSPESLRDRKHFMSKTLEGMLWLDIDGNGLRGSATDLSLNAQEYDTGVGGVKASLVECESNLLSYSISSLPDNGSGASTSLRSQDPDSGKYSFPTNSISVPTGRYYVMYQSPKNYRISGNILPLTRVGTDDSFQCIPKGGEGDEYRKEIEAMGDLDWAGYCARSIGCLEIDKAFDLLDHFHNHEYTNGLTEEDVAGTFETIVAMPSKSFLNVGLAEEPWPLDTTQFADATIELTFPSGADLSGAVPDDFEKSEVKKSMEMALGRMLAQGDASGEFDVQDVVLHKAQVSAAQAFASGGSRMLRGFQDAVDNAKRTSKEPTGETSVTYTFTTRGKYNPPPFEQLGTIMSDSINADPQGLVKNLKDRENIKLPPVFEAVEDAGARHLTLKVEKPKSQPTSIGQVIAYEAGENSKLPRWATILIIFDVFLIAILLGVLIWRRIFTRRVKKDKLHDLKGFMVGDLKMQDPGGRDFVANNRYLEDNLNNSNDGTIMTTIDVSRSDRSDRRKTRRHTHETALTSSRTSQSIASTSGSKASRHSRGSGSQGGRKHGRNHHTSSGGRTVMSAPSGRVDRSVRSDRRRKAKSERNVGRGNSRSRRVYSHSVRDEY